jgi:hypothetical protein
MPAVEMAVGLARVRALCEDELKYGRVVPKKEKKKAQIPDSQVREVTYTITGPYRAGVTAPAMFHGWKVTVWGSGTVRVQPSDESDLAGYQFFYKDCDFGDVEVILRQPTNSHLQPSVRAPHGAPA